VDEELKGRQELVGSEPAERLQGVQEGVVEVLGRNIGQ
jgi:hypothetical protein